MDDHRFWRRWVSRRIVCSLLTSCSEMSVFGSYWETWYFVVCEQACTCGHQMDKILWQTPESIVILHSSHMWIQTILLCGKHSTTMQTWIVFEDSDFAGDFEDSKSISGGVLCIFGSHTFVPISWMCKKQTSVSHSSTEIISLDAGSRMDGIPALTLWDLVIEVFHSSPNQTHKTKDVREPQGNLSQPLTRISIWSTLITFHQAAHNLVPMPCCMSLRITKPRLKIIIKGRSQTMRHVSRTRRVALDWLFQRIDLDAKIQIKYVDTIHQLADIMTKGSFSRDEWNNLLHLCNISYSSLHCWSQNFSFTSCTKTIAKRMQEQEREQDRGKVKADDEPGLHCLDKFFDCAESGCAEKPGDTESTLSKR